MRYPWIEVELRSLIDISGIEITYYNSHYSSHDDELFQNVRISVGQQSTPMSQGQLGTYEDRTKPLITKYKQVFMNSKSVIKINCFLPQNSAKRGEEIYISFAEVVTADFVMLQASSQSNIELGIDEISILKG